MATEKKYTLKEAEKILRREGCKTDGHDYSVVRVRTVKNPAGRPTKIVCTHCDEIWNVEKP